MNSKKFTNGFWIITFISCKCYLLTFKTERSIPIKLSLNVGAVRGRYVMKCGEFNLVANVCNYHCWYKLHFCKEHPGMTVQNTYQNILQKFCIIWARTTAPPWSGLIIALCSESQYYDPSLHWPGRVTMAQGGNTSREMELVVFNAALNIWPGPEITELIEIFQL